MNSSRLWFLALICVNAPMASAAPPITAAAFTLDGKFVVVGSQSGIEVRSWPKLTVQRRLETQLTHIHDLAYSPNGDSLIAAGGTPGEIGKVEIFKWPSAESVAVRELHSDLIYQVAWHPNGSGWATAGADRSVYVHGGKRLTGHSRPVLSAAYLPDGKWLVSAGVDNSLRLWDLSTSQLRRTLDNHTAPVRDLAVRPNHEGLPMIASASADRTVRLWQPTIGRLVRFARLPAEPLDIDWTPDGRLLLAACRDGHVRVIDPDTVEVVADIAALDGWVYTIATAPDGRRAIVGGENGQLRVIDFGTAQPGR